MRRSIFGGTLRRTLRGTRGTLVVLFGAVFLLAAGSAQAICQGGPTNPENDCDLDGFTVGAGDCNDDGTVCPAGACDPAGGPYVFLCPCGGRRGTLSNPGAPEVCDGENNNCDVNNLIDEGLDFDVDNDQVLSCSSCTALAAPDCDCNDNDPNVLPGQIEICNAIDDNCNGLSDERNGAGDPLQQSCYNGVASTDGVGLCHAGLQDCNATVAGTASYGACVGEVVPANPPANAETSCDGQDEDCDGTADDGLITDGDNDGVLACGTCQAPAAPDCDCNDGNGAIKPGASEVCDAVDNDCDALIDERNVAGDPLQQSCYSGPGGTNNVGLCQGGLANCNATVPGTASYGTCQGEVVPANPPANDEAICDGQDEDCDGTADDGLRVDVDGDGYAACGTCGADPTNCDCADGDGSRHPNAAEVCDAVDNDCDGLVDERNNGGAPIRRTCYNGPVGTKNVGLCRTGFETCDATVPGTSSFGSCQGQILPANPPANDELICDGQDEDCDGTADDGLLVDGDGDGYLLCGSCQAPGAPNCDCNDTAGTVHPGAPEFCDAIDNNCNALTDERNSAGDPIRNSCYSGPANTVGVGLCVNGFEVCDATVPGTSSFAACAGEVTPANPPGDNELSCDGQDEDCDGTPDDGLVTDLDGDGVRACGSCRALAAPDCDCNDNDPANYPGNAEICDNQDNNCDGVIDEGADDDGDGFRDCNFCADPICDCNDQDNTIFPNAPELCDCIDQNCDGDPWDGFADADGDGVPACAGAAIECNDTAGLGAQQHGAWCGLSALSETCDALDNDCDSFTDETPGGAALSQACYTGTAVTRGVGLCSDGSQTCNATVPGTAGFTACVGDVTPANPPAQDETTCDGVDDDCDGTPDDGLLIDVDGDGFRPCGSCGANPNNCDCDDAHGAAHPGGIESCDALDNDCDGAVDNKNAAGDPMDRVCYTGPAGTVGVGECSTGTETCNATLPGVESFSACAGEVVPTNAPDQAETICNALDDDCDGTPDDGLLVDADADGARLCGSCQAPDAPNCDCNDAVAEIHPGATEICDAIDNDCNALVDERNATGEKLQQSCYTGLIETLGVGACQAGLAACNATLPGMSSFGSCQGEVLPANPPDQDELICNFIDDDCDGTEDDGAFDVDGDGYVLCDGDCNDADATIHPDALEVCDNVDNDCDGVTDGVSTACYAGPDGTAGVGACQAGTSDCAQGVPIGECFGQVVPATEICNLIDDDCDGLVDEDFDGDGDGVPSCALCPDLDATQCDCDDTDPFNAPGFPDICDCQDNNCNDIVDEGEACLGAPCFDFDGDGFTNCDGDCDDSDTLIGPHRPEVFGNGRDDNCDGSIDEDVDEDLDGYTTGEGDCDDRFSEIHPGATEQCDGFDDNCNGVVDEGFDEDGDFATVCAGDCDDHDAARSPFRKEICGNGVDDNCDGVVDENTDRDGDGVTTCEGDCNDFSPRVHGAFGDVPAAEEVCDGQDNDCNNQTDEGFDEDGDGVATCFGDCDDANADVNPLRYEIPGNQIDDNCNGQVDEGSIDADGDGFSPRCGDCDDSNPNINPHAEEICDRIDNNCDSYTDAILNAPELCSTCFDADGDGFTNCQGDCNDLLAQVYPGAPEVCDLLDNDCDGRVDLDADGLQVCRDEQDAGPGDAGTSTPDSGTLLAGDAGRPNTATSSPRQPNADALVVGCTCAASTSSVPPDATFYGALLGLALLGLRRKRQQRSRLFRQTLWRTLWVLTPLLSIVLFTACEAGLIGDVLNTPLTVDAGVSPTQTPEPTPKGDGGTADPSPPPPVDAGTTECDVSGVPLLQVIDVPGGANPFAVPQDLSVSLLQGVSALGLDDDNNEVHAFVVRRELPDGVDPNDERAAIDLAQRQTLTLDVLPGSPAVDGRIERTRRASEQQNIGRMVSTTQALHLASPTTAHGLRVRLLAAFGQVDLGTFTGLPPAPSQALIAQDFQVQLLFLVTPFELVVVGVVTPQARAIQNQPVMNDLTGGTHFGPPGFGLRLRCEHKVLPELKADFLWVIDNSGSMQEEQSALVDAAAGFYDRLRSSGLDFRLGVVTTDSEVLRGDGFTTELTSFQENIAVGINGNGLEMGLEYGLNALDLAQNSPDANRRLRPDAARIVIFFSDEDSTNLRPLGDYGTAYAVANALTFAIVGPLPYGCQLVGFGVARPGIGYIETAIATGGTTGSICNPNLSQTIEGILLGALGAASRAPLARTPVSGTLTVTTTQDVARSRTQGFDYEPSSNTVVFFGDIPPAGSGFTVAYAEFAPVAF